MTASSLLVEPAYASIPPYTRTLGPEVADLCEMVGFAPDPEQRMALDAIFAVRPDGKSAAMELALIVSRQNMKTGLFKQCALGWLFITDQRLVIWSAHEFSTSQESHRDLAELITGSDYLRKRVKKIPTGNGDEGVELLTGQRVKFKARTKTGGRGLSGDKIVLDEAFALTADHLGALLPTLSVRPDPQVVYGSSAGLESSEVLRSIRDRGRPGKDPRLAYLEWVDDLPGECEQGDACDHQPMSATGCRMDDERRWYRANPQLGRRMTLEFVQGERRAMPPSEFGRERLGWWDEDPRGARLFAPGVWDALIDTSPELGPPTFGIATAPDRSWSAIAAAWRRPDGMTQVLVGDDYRRDATWVTARAAELRERYGATFVVDDASRGLVPDATEPSKAEQAEAHNALSDAVLAGTLRHGNEPALNVSVRGAQWRTSGDTRVLDRKGSTDISPLVAAALAVHGLGANRAPNIW